MLCTYSSRSCTSRPAYGFVSLLDGGPAVLERHAVAQPDQDEEVAVLLGVGRPGGLGQQRVAEPLVAVVEGPHRERLGLAVGEA